MAVYEWTDDPPTGFFYSYDDTLPTTKDYIRKLIGDVNGVPVAYMSDNAIIATAAAHGNDLYTSAAECAETCAARCLQVYQEIRQGSRFEIKNFDPVKAQQAFMQLANMIRNKNTSLLPSYGALAGKIKTPPRTDRRSYQ